MNFLIGKALERQVTPRTGKWILGVLCPCPDLYLKTFSLKLMSEVCGCSCDIQVCLSQLRMPCERKLRTRRFLSLIFSCLLQVECKVFMIFSQIKTHDIVLEPEEKNSRKVKENFPILCKFDSGKERVSQTGKDWEPGFRKSHKTKIRETFSHFHLDGLIFFFFFGTTIKKKEL